MWCSRICLQPTLFQVDFIYQLTFYNSKSTFCYSRSTLSINWLFATPSQLCHKSQKGKSTFCYSKSTLSATQLLSGMIKDKASWKEETNFLLFQVDFACQSTFFNFKLTFHRLQKRKSTSCNSRSTLSINQLFVALGRLSQQLDFSVK